ncbi:MAG: hypothetical protein GY851_20675 [bacterium]|nr:hypothetical protein [bacterium]
MRVRMLSLFAILTFLPCAVCATADDSGVFGDVVYLSDVCDDLAADIVQGWGTLGRDTAAVPTDGRAGGELRLGEKAFDKGLGHHAPGQLVFELPEGAYTGFAATVGVHWQGGGRGSVVFQVLVDGEVQFDSGRMTDSDPAQNIDVPVAGARELVLRATDGGDGYGCDMANWIEARLVRDPNALRIGAPSVMLCGAPAPEPSSEVCGFALIAEDTGPQVASLGRRAYAASLRDGESVDVTIPVSNAGDDVTVTTEVAVLDGKGATISLGFDGGSTSSMVLREGSVHLTAVPGPDRGDTVLRLRTTGGASESLVRWRNVKLSADGEVRDLPVMPRPSKGDVLPARVLPALRPAMEQTMIEWDWRMADGIGTTREAATYAAAVERILGRGETLLATLRREGTALDDEAAAWQALRDESTRLTEAKLADDAPQWENLWLRTHHDRRRIVFSNPLAQVGPLLFVKRVPASFSHQLTQYYGRCARPGGGLFVLDAPGVSMACRQLAPDELPLGSVMQPEVSHDASRIVFAHTPAPTAPQRGKYDEFKDRRYHLYEIRPNGLGLRQLTDGPYDDFSPRELPNGQLMFISTRRGGYHRCGRGPCDVYTLSLAEHDGSNPRTVSYHETQEWDPAVLADGRVIYTRWDYVDRNAVHYQQLWTVRPDGSAPTAYYGNNTFNPVGVWEPVQVPNSPYVMATAAAHHAMTAGSIILLDTTKGVDGLEPIARLTPDAPFPESETHVAPRSWHAPGSPKEYDTPQEAKRWPGHCYRTPYPLSEQFFLAAYSYDPLIGEPDSNKPNMFGIYFVDAFGNRELVYRDLNIASQWPVPIRPRAKAPAIPSMRDPKVADEGTFFLQDVYASDPALPKGSVKSLRIVQVLPKTTPHANTPTVGFANASPGKQVLGTVPVYEDGSAVFHAPAGIPLAFQALDEHGRAVQVMRSITYLQPGERASCVGCHEHRLTAPPQMPKAMALRHEPSRIDPGPDGSKPLSYPLLVQPVLDKHCVKCHGGETPAGPKDCPIVLTGEPEGRYSKSYNVLAKRVPYSSWGGLETNGEPMSQPGRFGAVASSVMDMLLKGHHEVKLARNDMDRLVTWMDANALFYGTFDPEDQARQLRGERIEGPALE